MSSDHRDINAPMKTHCSLVLYSNISPECWAVHSLAEIQTVTRQGRGGKARYLVQLIVFLQHQSDDVTHEGDFPLRESSLQELLLAQHRLVVENVPQRLRDIKTAVLTTSGWEIHPFTPSLHRILWLAL